MTVKWPHIIKDNFLSNEHFNYLLNFSEQKVNDDGIGISKNKIWLEGKVEGKLNHKYLIKFYNDYQNKLFNLLKDLAKDRIPMAKWIELNLVWTGKNYKFKIHEDSPNKLLSIVVYLAPRENIGTILYSDEIGSDKTVIEWIQNRALIFARKDGITWHSYEGDGISTRYALVLNIRSDI